MYLELDDGVQLNYESKGDPKLPTPCLTQDQHREITDRIITDLPKLADLGFEETAGLGEPWNRMMQS